MATKPTKLNVWNTDNVNDTAPNNAKIALGWEVAEAPSSSTFNWGLKYLFKLAAYVLDGAWTGSTQIQQENGTADYAFEVLSGNVGFGIRGVGNDGVGVQGESVTSFGVIGSGPLVGVVGFTTAGNTPGGQFTGNGSGSGLTGTGGATGTGITGTGGGTSGAGGTFIGAAGNATGVTATGHGTSAGVLSTGGGTSGAGLSGTGGASNGVGVIGQGTGTGDGMAGTGGGTAGAGVRGTGGGNGAGIIGSSSGTGSGVNGSNSGSGAAGSFDSSSGTGYGLIAQADTTTPVKAAFRIVPQDTSPSSPSEGDIYMNSSTHFLMVYDGSAWVKVGSQ